MWIWFLRWLKIKSKRPSCFCSVLLVLLVNLIMARNLKKGLLTKWSCPWREAFWNFTSELLQFLIFTHAATETFELQSNELYGVSLATNLKQCQGLKSDHQLQEFKENREVSTEQQQSDEWLELKRNEAYEVVSQLSNFQQRTII